MAPTLTSESEKPQNLFSQEASLLYDGGDKDRQVTEHTVSR